MDADLLAGFRRGERAALARVYSLYVGGVERVAKIALINLTSSTEGLADVVHEVFLRAFSPNARASYDGQRDYKPYLLTLARNVIVDWAKRAGREIPTADLVDLTATQSADPAAADESPFSPAVVSIAATYIESLPVNLRAIHHRRFVLAEPQRQAADALGISRQNLRTLEKQLLIGLRSVLEKAGVEIEEGETKARADAKNADAERAEAEVSSQRR